MATAAAVAVFFVKAIAVAVIGSIVSKSTESKSKGSTGGKTSHQLNTRSSRVTIPVAYGQFRAGVNKTFLHVENPYLYMICELSEGEINGLVREDGNIYTTTASELPTGSNPCKVYLDDKLYTKYGGLVRIEFFNGSSSQSVCSTLQSATSKWDQTLRYTAYMMVRIEFDPDKFNSEPDITAEIQGTKIYNPITEVTEYSNNPALCAYDYLTRSSQRGGIGISADRIGLADLATAIDYCDAKGWTCNMPLNENIPAADNLDRILANFRGDIIQSEDVFKIRFRDLNYEAVAMALDEDDIIRQAGGFSTLEITQPDTGSRPNALRATHLSSEKGYKADDLVLTDAAAITAVGDLREEKLDLFGLSDPDLVQKMLNYHLERRQLNRTVTLLAGSRCMGLEPLDIITLEHAMPGWDDQYLRIAGLTINGDHTVSLYCQEENETFYDDTYNLTAHDWDITDLPGPLDAVQAVVNVSHAEEVYYYRDRSFTRWTIDFDPPAAEDYPWWDYAEIWLQVGTAGEWRYMTRSNTNYQVDPVEEGETYSIKIRSVSVFGAKEDFDFCTTITSTITGLTDAPGNITDLMAIATGDTVTIFATPLVEPDLDGYEIRRGESADGGIFISYNKNISLRINGVRPGTHTFWAAAKNNAGLYSAAWASATVTVFVPPGYSELATYGSWAWDFTSGSHDDTEHVTYDSEDAVKCSHTDIVPFHLSGSWTSPTHDLGAIEKVRLWGDFRVSFVASATTWDGVFPMLYEGSELVVDGDFDNWTGDDPDDWTESNCDAAEDTGETGSGAKITATNDGGGIYQDISVTAEKYYVVRGYYKNTAGDTAQLSIYDLSNASWLTAPPSRDLDDSTAYKAVTYIFYCPAGCNSIRLWLAANTNGDIVWFDEVSIKAIDDGDSTQWDDIDPDTDMDWADIFQPPQAARLEATLRYKELIGDSWSEISFFEMICAEVEAQYISVVVSITDPTADSNLYLRELNMSAYEGPQ